MKKQRKTISLDNLLSKPTTISKKFHNETKIKKIVKNKLHPDFWPKIWKTIQYKEYPRLNSIMLSHESLPKVQFLKILTQRHSARNFSAKLISLSKLSALLEYCVGKKNASESYRFYPSAGARFPIETYLLCLKTELPKGLYHYNVKNHALEELLLFQSFDFEKYFGQDFIKKSSCILIFAAVFERNMNKYGQRGYRHILQEAGHIGQNVYLLSSALGLLCCATGEFVDDNLHKLLDIDGLEEAVVSIIAIGTK